MSQLITKGNQKHLLTLTLIGLIISAVFIVLNAMFYLDTAECGLADTPRLTFFAGVLFLIGLFCHVLILVRILLTWDEFDE